MKFSTFERQANLCVNRLKKIKERVSTLVALEEITAERLEDLFQYVEESRTKVSEIEKALSKMLLQDSVPDYDEEKVLTLEDEISELRFSINSLARPHLVNRVASDTSFSHESNSNSNSGSSLKLPRLTLKTFNGSTEQWLSFFSLFESSVHNSSNLTDVEKFQYLLSSLQGEPLSLVKNLPITSQNYGIAWNTLQQRYQNTRKLIMFHMNNLIDMPSVSSSTAKNLRNFISHCQENMQALVALRQDVKKNNGILSALLLRKLDSDIRKKFEEGRDDSQKMPEVQEILTYLENECSHMEAANLSHSSNLKATPASPSQHSAKSTMQTSKNFNRTPKTILLSTSKQLLTCTFCSKTDHIIYRCNDFRCLSPQEKYDFVKKHHFCFNCLGNGHSLKECKSRNVCSKCNKKHHTWLHLQKTPHCNSPSSVQQNKLSNEASSTSALKTSSVLSSTSSPLNDQSSGSDTRQISPAESSKNAIVFFSQNSNRPDCTILLGTTLVQLTSPNGHSLIVRAVVDSASMVTCISESVARLLSVERTRSQSENVDGLSSCQIKTKGLSRVNILTLSGSSVATNHPVIILDKITSSLPHSCVSPEVKEKYKTLVLADPTFHVPSAVDMLLGADVYTKIMTGERILIHESLPAAMNSVFGFIIIGSAPVAETSPDSPSNVLTTLLTVTPEVDLHRSLQRFWAIEEPPFKPSSDPEEEYCENHFDNNHFRDSSGRYVVRLPIKNPHPPLGDSADIARRRFFSLEKRMNSDPDFKKSYVECMNDYLVSGDIEIVKSPQLKDTEHFFLPHHAVTKEESSSTKTRVVFDASARSSSGVSLNQILYAGPKLHNEICDIIVDFRCYPIVFSCDIKKMFRQILVHPDDRNYQLLFWRENPTQPLSVYRLTTVVFGFSCSPFLAIRTLKQLVKDEGSKFPLAARALENQIYVDDLFLGANSIEEAVSLQNETVQLLLKGGFHLRKWKTNCPELVSSLPEEYKEKPLYFQSGKSLYNFLGIKWTSESDCFTFHYDIKTEKFTKRSILSTVAQIFDPCGWLAPITFWAKSLLQLLWTLGLQWDEIVPANIAEKWERFLSQLPALDQIRIPRYLSLHPSSSDVQLHGFSDGSEAGYSAVVYLRCIYPDDQINVHLIIAKSKVAPLKRISVPRIELCGAYLLAKLLHYSASVISKHCQLKSVTAWSDSSVVLSWIHTPPYRLKVYVANRVAQIQDWIPAHSWSHISTHQNPADCASRGILPASLQDHHLWWHGPPWLQAPESTWPIPRFTTLKEEHLPEIKIEPLNVMVVTKEPDFLIKFSSWSTLQRVIAFILRFKNNSCNINKETGFLKLNELDRAVSTICKVIQQSSFREDISCLKSKKICSSRLAPLSPFLDENELIRVGGRIKHSLASYGTKHPIILPKSHHITNLIIDFYHLKYLHAGPQFLQAVISQKFWILSSRSAIRSRVYKCIRCFKCNPRTITQKMGDLPQHRVTPSRVFNNCGTDFLGPFFVKSSTLRKASPIKAYICIFICFSVKAVHLEVVTDLSTEAYLAALTRFVSRRGLCSNIYSDCGTNYVGAANEIQKILKAFLTQEKTQEALNKFSTENNIKFHFLPPAAPHQGGLWERTVRSVKHHLRRVIGDQILTLEEFITLTTRIEAILNSRPITPLSSDPSEIDYLTPGHFLVGGPLLSLPEHDWEGLSTNRLSRWKLVQALTQSFWKRWHREYLYTLQQRGKWRSPQPNIQIGDLVLVHEPNQPPLSWRLGRVISTSPGPDGLVRVVHLQTSRGPLSRPITKVSPLPIDD